MGSNNIGRSRSGDVRIWNAAMNELLVTLQGLNTPIMSVVFNPDGQTLAIAVDRKVKVWNVATGKLLRTLDGHADDVWAVAGLSSVDKVAAWMASYDDVMRKHRVEMSDHKSVDLESGVEVQGLQLRNTRDKRTLLGLSAPKRSKLLLYM